MASPTPRSYPHFLKFAFTVAFIISFTFLPSLSDGKAESWMKEKKMVLGSKPPGCENKCSNCRPCMATLVIPVHFVKSLKASSQREDDSYYLLSWKCICGDKLYQP